MKPVSVKIELTKRHNELVQDQIATGRFVTPSEVIREGLRLFEEKELARETALASLRQDIEAGWQESERGEVVSAQSVVAEIRAMSHARRTQKKTKSRK